MPAFKSRWLLVVATALVVAALYAWWAPSRQPAQPPTPSTVAGGPATAPTAPHHRQDATALRAALPAPNAPLSVVAKDLKSLSDAGNSAASMRLFEDLRSCALRDASISALNGVYYHQPNQTDADYARLVQDRLAQKPELEKALDYLSSTDVMCKGMGRAAIDARGEYLRAAALQDDAEAEVCYAVSDELGPPYLSAAWLDYASRWRDEAPLFAQRALDAGAPGILGALIDAYMPDDPELQRTYPLSQVLAPDPQAAYTMSLLYSRLVTGAQLDQSKRNLSKLSAILSAQQVADAQAAADNLWPRFSNVEPDAKEVLFPCSKFLSVPGDTLTGGVVGQ